MWSNFWGLLYRFSLLLVDIHEHSFLNFFKGHGYNWKGSYDLPLQEALAGAYNLRPFDCPLPVKIVMIFSEYMQRNYQNKFYGKAQNLVQHLTREYNRILKDYDVIVMPTLPAKAFKLPSKGHSVYGSLFFYLNYLSRPNYHIQKETLVRI